MTSTDTRPLHPRLVLTTSADAGDLRFLEERIDAHNIALTGIDDVALIALVARDEHRAIVAGLHGWTWGGCCEVKTLWVDERWRGRGVGTHLLLAAEREARAHGAGQIVLSTHSFQAPEFYRRLGFEVVGAVDDYPVGHRSIHLRKRLR